jgi:diguanylate cyclase (GGDEF)-like protein
MLAVLMSFFVLGSGLDLLFGTIRLIWPWGTSALLYIYFFIVQSEARIDPLTGIGNRFSFNEFTDKLSRRASGESWVIVMIDMDHFKMINDTLGHQEGDNALCDMAAILRDSIRRNDFAARYGGDEFVLTAKVEKNADSLRRGHTPTLQDGFVENSITKLMNRIQSELDRYNAKNIRPFKLEISYGYDVYTSDGKQSIQDFLNHIDGLMYKQKQEHRRLIDEKEEASR